MDWVKLEGAGCSLFGGVGLNGNEWTTLLSSSPSFQEKRNWHHCSAKEFAAGVPIASIANARNGFRTTRLRSEQALAACTGWTRSTWCRVAVQVFQLSPPRPAVGVNHLARVIGSPRPRDHGRATLSLLSLARLCSERQQVKILCVQHSGGVSRCCVDAWVVLKVSTVSPRQVPQHPRTQDI
jgi:hypothetical protein